VVSFLRGKRLRQLAEKGNVRNRYQGLKKDCQLFLYINGTGSTKEWIGMTFLGRQDRWVSARFALIAVAAVAAASVIGQIATFPNLVPWYAGLTKPSFNPPNWVFGPVWTTLYLLMAFSVWRILRLPAGSMRRTALNLFFIQLVLNAAWSWMFFAANSPLLGMANIVPQFALIVTTVVVFYRLDRLAAYSLVPLTAWVAFATVLNVSIWMLNR
jgi:tryptophan-rich sensory protein